MTYANARGLDAPTSGRGRKGEARKATKSESKGRDVEGWRRGVATAIVTMRLVDALNSSPRVCIWRVLESRAAEKENWEVEAVAADILAETDGFYIVKGKNIQPNGAVRDCYIDVSLPERISDYAYLSDGDSLDVRYHHEFAGEIICVVPIDSFGVYELFYSRIAPEIGIAVLRDGLKVARRKQCIAEDLAYILRDERRFTEAAEAFRIAANDGPSSHFIYSELAACYDEIGNKELADEHRKKFEKFDRPFNE